jgi:hypothetical protein
VAIGDDVPGHALDTLAHPDPQFFLLVDRRVGVDVAAGEIGERDVAGEDTA